MFLLDPNFEEIYMYLNLDANECLERIKQRRRSEEDNVSLDLLQNIQNSHEEMMKIINPSGNTSDRLKTTLGIDVERKVAIVKSQIVLTGNLYSYKKHDIQTLRRAVKAE